MKVLILGSTGRTGQQLVKQALEQNHDVTAFARDPSRLVLRHEKLKVIEGNALDKNRLLQVLQGKDAVLSALGMGKSLKSNDLISNAVSILIPAMNSANVRRLIFLSAFGVGETFSQANWLQKIIFKTFLRNIYADKAKAEELIHRSNLEWTLVYPVLLTDAPGKGQYIAGEKFQMKGMPKVSRADVAAFMLRLLTDNAFIRKGAAVMS